MQLARLAKRPDVDWSHLSGLLAELRQIPSLVAEQVLYDLKYAGYVTRQQLQVDRQRRLADKRIPRGFDFHSIRQLRAEAREKLARVQPESLHKPRVSAASRQPTWPSYWPTSRARADEPRQLRFTHAMEAPQAVRYSVAQNPAVFHCSGQRWEPLFCSLAHRKSFPVIMICVQNIHLDSSWRVAIIRAL